MASQVIHTDITKFNLFLIYMDELLKNLYYNPLTGFQGLDKLYTKAKEVNKKITKKDVKEWLSTQETHQITQSEKKTKRQFNTIISPEIRNNFQMDIMYLPNPNKNKFKYLLTCIDVHSRKLFAEPIKNKNKEDALEAFQKIIKKSGKPVNLNVDAGGEFDNGEFKNFCDKNNIKIWMSNPLEENKNAIIERFHRTLRNLLLKYEIALKKPYITDLQTIIENYNNTEHKTIKSTPNDVWKGKEKNNQVVNYVVYDFKVGDKVRHANKKTAFEKASSTENFSRDIYTISRIDGNSYYLKNSSGYELKKKFKGFELKQAVGDGSANKYIDENKAIEKELRQTKKIEKELETTLNTKASKKQTFYEIEKILSPIVLNNEKYYQVKWKGYVNPTNEPRSQLFKDIKVQLTKFEKENNVKWIKKDGNLKVSMK